VIEILDAMRTVPNHQRQGNDAGTTPARPQGECEGRMSAECAIAFGRKVTERS